MALPPIIPVPYTIVSNQTYKEEVTIQIDKAPFNNVAAKEGTLVFLFSSCLFKKVIISNLDEIDFPDISIAFHGCLIERIEVENITTKNISISFSRTVVSGRIASSNIKSVSLSDCILWDSIFVLNVQKVHVSYQHAQLAAEKWADLLHKVKGFDIATASAEKQSYHIQSATSLYFSSDFKGDRSREMKNLHLSITYDPYVEDKNSQVSNVLLNSFSLTGSASGKLSIENVSIQNWYIHDFLPKDQATFFNVRPVNSHTQCVIGIHKSNLGNTWFDNVSFIQYKTISFYLTKVSSAVFTSCRFPNTYQSFNTFMSIENVHYPNERPENYAKDVYELMLQLKMALQGTGNYYESQKLQAVAHDALKKIKDIPKHDRIILCINSLSNGHGLSIKKPFWWLLGGSVFFYILYLLSLGRIFNSNEFDWSLVGYYFAFIDLTHRTDFLVDKANYNFGSLTIDYFNKVFVGFFIYQFIASFRKYGRN